MVDKVQSLDPKENLLGLAFLFVFLLVLGIIWVIQPDPPSPTPTDVSLTQPKTGTPPTATIVTLSPPSTATRTPTKSTEPTLTPVNYPTPFPSALGINTPEGFDVLYWYTDYIVCDKNPNRSSFQVYGLIFPLGTPTYSYKFSFWRFDKAFTPQGLTATPTPTPTPTPTATPTLVPAPTAINPPTTDPIRPVGESVIFDEAVLLFKDEYYHVTISFDWDQGNAIWIDDLFYPSTKKDSRCKEK